MSFMLKFFICTVFCIVCVKNIWCHYGGNYTCVAYRVAPQSNMSNSDISSYKHYYEHNIQNEDDFITGDECSDEEPLCPFHSMVPPGNPDNIRCPNIPDYCGKNKYRTHDGSCNNLKNPGWGVSYTPYNRLLPPRYGDGIESPTKSVTGEELPNVREISLKLFGLSNLPDPKYNIFNMQWGQIMAHDMGLLAGGQLSRKYATQCCTPEGGFLPKNKAHKTCFPIAIPCNDPVYSKAGIECLNFVRTLTDKNLQCDSYNNKNKYAEQINTVTHFLDLSFIYGNTEEENQQLREFYKGLLRVERRGGHSWLPRSLNPSKECDLVHPNEACYRSGDKRVNQNPGLVIKHIILHMEHNRIAKILHKINPHWNDEKLYQEARKINIAQYQYISYYEWLPIFLGWEHMVKCNLTYDLPSCDSYVNDYNSSVNPSTLNEHSNSAYRYCHSQVQGRLDLLSEIRTLKGSLSISDWFHRPGILEFKDNLCSLTRGHVTQSADLTDDNFNTEIRHKIDKGRCKLGSDLRALDIQRDRDHGLAKYNDARECAGLKKAKSWEDYLDHISESDIDILKCLYKSHEDVDLSVGAGLEKHCEDALFGPTFRNIVSQQFYNTRVGDRFFFENENKKTGFTKPQLEEIRKASLARLICDNIAHVKSVQPKAFFLVCKDNPIKSCKELPKVDLSKWEEEKPEKSKKKEQQE